MYVTEARLSPYELARLLKLMVDHAYQDPQVVGVDALVGAVARKFDLSLTEEHWGQVYGAVSLVVPQLGGTVSATVTGSGLDQAIRISDVNRTPDTLGKVIFQAWQNISVATRQEPAAMWLPETGGLLVSDPRDEDVVDLSIAEMFHLVAHDKNAGHALLAEPVLACGIAAALLAELLLLGLVELDVETHDVKATGQPSASVLGISGPVRQALEVIQDGGPDTLGSWLNALSPKGYRAVRRHLVQAGRATRVEGRFTKRVRYPPASELVDSILRVATRPLAAGRMPGAPYAVLVELAKVARLTQLRYGDWVYVHRIDPGASLELVPGRERFDLLLALTRAEVTDLLTRP